MAKNRGPHAGNQRQRHFSGDTLLGGTFLQKFVVDLGVEVHKCAHFCENVTFLLFLDVFDTQKALKREGVLGVVLEGFWGT